MQRALQESMETSSLRLGTPLTTQTLREMGVYFEWQDPGSDTCGQNALNNLCQRPMFSIEELQQAEASHAQATEGGSFAQIPSLNEVPSGFFDVEALKIAAAAKDLEIVDVEPVPEYRSSRCFAFAEASQGSLDGSFLLGFLVYDRQPGQMHYYALRRHHNLPGMWLKLDSQLPSTAETARNALLRDAEIWEIYTQSKALFSSWLLRWYPVVFRPGAVREVSKVMERRGYGISAARAKRVLMESGWLVSAAVQRLLDTLPQVALRELLVKFARPSETEMRSLLEASGWDLTNAQPAIDRVLKQRIALAKQVDGGVLTRNALSLSDWDPSCAASLLALQLQLGVDQSHLPELQEALERSGGDADRAEAVVQLKPAVGSLSGAAKLLEQTGSWSVPLAKRVLEIRKRFPRVSVPVAREVLLRNDDDPHAACEMLEEFRQRIQRIASEQVDQVLLMPGEEGPVGETALNISDWDPRHAFVNVRKLAGCVKQTRRIASHHDSRRFFSIDAVLTALAAVENRPSAACAVLFGDDPLQPVRRRPKDPAAHHPPTGNPDEDYTCSMM